MCVCFCVCFCDLLFDLVRPPSQGPASYQIKAASSGLWKEVCMCACVRTVEDRGVGEVGVFSLLLTQDNGTAKESVSEYSLN